MSNTYLEYSPLPTEGEEGGVGEASFIAGDSAGGVEDKTLEPEVAASSESPADNINSFTGL